MHLTETAPALENAAPQLPGFWRSVREALRGSRQDYTEGPIGRAILLLAVPMVLEMVMESVFAVVDVFFVSKLGADAVATVGLTESLLVMVYTVAMGLSIGVTATVARRIGEHDRDAAAAAAFQGIVLGLTIAIALGIAGILLAPRLLGVMGAPATVIAMGSGYARVMLGGNACILMLFLINAIFRGAGDAAIAMRVLWLANAINIVLGPCLIFGIGPFPRMGVLGAATATTIGRSTGAMFAASQLLRRESRVRIERRHVRVNLPLMAKLVRLSASGTLQVLIGSASWIGLVRIIATFGSAALAGYTIGIRIILFALLPSWGMSNAAATMVGQALGAGKPERAEQAVWRAGTYNVFFLGVIGLVFVIFAPGIVRLFTIDPSVVPYGAQCLRYVAAGFVFYAYGMVLGQSFNGAGDTWTPTLLNFFIFWLFEIPLAYVLSVSLHMGPRGAFIAMPLAFSMFALAAAVLFRRGKWKTRKV
jgi:putative MATE family efflux protein